MSLRVFYGDDRVAIAAAIKKLLGNDYEVMEGAELTAEMMPSVFLGTSLFAKKRKIVVKDLAENKEAFEKIVDYVVTEHEVVLWEAKMDKRSVVYKSLVKAGVEMREFKLPEMVDRSAAFKIYDAALVDGARAVRMLNEVQAQHDPYVLVGAWTWKAVDIFNRSGGRRGRAQLKKLAELDLALKKSSMEPWALVKSFLLTLK